MANMTLLEILARMNPYLWEIIHPHVPVEGGGIRQLSRAAEVELNPQPIPPGRELAFAGAALAKAVAQGAVLTQAQSQGGSEFLSSVVDDWCGTRGPRPWPPGWPHWAMGPGDPVPWRVEEPDPHPWGVASMFAAAAVVFASFSGALEDGELRDAFRQAADKAGERAEAELREG